MSDKELNTGEKIFYSIIFVMIVLLLFVVVGAWIFEMTLGSVNSNTWWVYLLSSIVGWLEVAVALVVVSSPRWIWVLHANHKDNVKRFQAQREQREREQEETTALNRKVQYQGWLDSSDVDDSCKTAEEHLRRLAGIIGKVEVLLSESAQRNVSLMSREVVAAHERDQSGLRSSLEQLVISRRLWNECLLAFRFHQAFQRELRSIPPWLGGVAYKKRPTGTESLWPQQWRVTTPVLALEETNDALKRMERVSKIKKSLHACTSWEGEEARAFAQTIMQREEEYISRLARRAVECQVLVDRTRARQLMDDHREVFPPSGGLTQNSGDWVGPDSMMRSSAVTLPPDIEPVDVDLPLHMPDEVKMEGAPSWLRL